MKFSKEFKEAISHLPSIEKDKLLYRLLKKDILLAKRLEFELLSDANVEDKRAEMQQHISEEVQRMTKGFYSTGYLNMDIRYLSGSITEYVKVTKDKFGEVSLNIQLLTEVLQQNREHILNASFGRASKLLVAIIARAFKILLLSDKLHEDLLFDLKEDSKQLGLLIGDNDYLMRTAIFHGFDVNWLISGSPADIQKIYKDLRDRGYLR
jgi:hypothetical protein